MGSFRSYIGNFHGKEERQVARTSPEKQLNLLTDETIVAMCKTVNFRTTNPNGSVGFLFGSLLCTDYRIAFVPLLTLESSQRDYFIKRSTILNEESEVSLGNVNALYTRGSKNDKFRSLVATLSFTDPVFTLKIVTKARMLFSEDFRVLAFDFPSVDVDRPNSVKEVINALWHYAFPQRLDLFYSLSHCIEDDASLQWLRFNSAVAWTSELDRTAACKLTNGWRVSHVNASFVTTASYPEICVLPRVVLDSIVQQTASTWTQNRFPIWCWSSRNGSALLRCSRLNVVGEANDESWKSLLAVVQDAHVKKREPNVFQLDLSVQSVAQSFALLSKLCTDDAGDKDLLSGFFEKPWLVDFETCGWMSLVQSCLEKTTSILELLQEHSVVLQGETGRDFSCLISSLVQICADSFFRTKDGFMILLAKEWIAFGHPFAQRLHGLELTSPGIVPERKAPVFLLFLDCVNQLTRQFPESFEYTTYFLIALWDTALASVSGAFLLNSMKDRKIYEQRMSCPWNLSSLFTREYMRLFTNPFYAIANERSARCDDLAWLMPSCSNADVEFWGECFLRFYAPAQYAMGGSAQRLLAEQKLVANVLSLKLHVEKLRDSRISSPPSLTSKGKKERELREAFHWDTEQICNQLNSRFPYSCAELRPPNGVLRGAKKMSSERVKARATAPVTALLPPKGGSWARPFSMMQAVNTNNNDYAKGPAASLSSESCFDITSIGLLKRESDAPLTSLNYHCAQEHSMPLPPLACSSSLTASARSQVRTELSPRKSASRSGSVQMNASGLVSGNSSISLKSPNRSVVAEDDTSSPVRLCSYVKKLDSPTTETLV